jgi:hypothetical protein
VVLIACWWWHLIRSSFLQWLNMDQVPEQGYLSKYPFVATNVPSKCNLTAQIKPVQDKSKETAVRWTNSRISVYRYLTINNNASFLVYHSLFVCLHLIMYTHCRSRNCLPFRNPWGNPQYLVRFVLLDLFFCMQVLYNVVCKQLFTDLYNKT